ncbi:jeltraxin-like [Leptodactylus fuscus]|uniref:jeltraxin-like n=1 Tax=Leptodactylus fuscus TaxID=238119 RepID=UPI003F4E6650
MRGLTVFFCLFVGCHVAGASEKTIMLFPEPTITDYVILNPTQKVLKQMTVCLRSYSDLTRDYGLLSIATPDKDNAFLIYPMPPNNISISINNEDIYFKVDPEVLDWKSSCVTWDSETGLLQLWINGKRYPGRITRTRSPISPQMFVILGQDQDSFGGKFDVAQSFVGEMCDVNMWDYVLPDSLIMAYLYNDNNVNGNTFKWIEGKYRAKGSILVSKNRFYPK